MSAIRLPEIWMLVDQTQWLTSRTYFLLLVILVALGIASLVGLILSRRESLGIESAIIGRYNHKLRVWWMMAAILVFGFLDAPNRRRDPVRVRFFLGAT